MRRLKVFKTASGHWVVRASRPLAWFPTWRDAIDFATTHTNLPTEVDCD